MNDVIDVYFDSCSVDRFADEGFDPVRDLAGTEFQIVYTRDLVQEYQLASEQEKLPDTTKVLHRRVIESGNVRGLFGFDGPPFSGWDEGMWASPEQDQTIKAIKTKDRPQNPIPKNRTDAHLVALSQDAIVITDNFNQPHWKQGPKGKGRVIFWQDFLPILRLKNEVAAAIRHFISCGRYAASSAEER
jgi:hypothetical protein